MDSSPGSPLPIVTTGKQDELESRIAVTITPHPNLSCETLLKYFALGRTNGAALHTSPYEQSIGTAQISLRP
jgi:hypothetical protein